MRSLNVSLNQSATFGRQLTAVAALAALLTLCFGPLEAGATTPSGVAPGNYPCSTNGVNSGDFAISYENGQVVASDLNQDCAGTASIPEGVTKIGAFAYNPNLLRVEIPASATELVNGAFFSSENLAAVEIAADSRLTRIPDNTFGYTGVRSFVVPARVTSIGPGSMGSLSSITFAPNSQLRVIEYLAFGWSGLTSIELPSSLVEIQNEAFKNSSSLGSVSFASGSQLTTIGDDVFKGLPSQTISIPDAVTTIGQGWFSSGVNFTISANNQGFTLENGVLLNKTRTKLIAYDPGLTASTFAIPATVTELRPYAFKSSQLQTLEIPATVSTLGEYTFANSNQLEAVTFSGNATVSRIPDGAFQSTGLTSIVIPASVSEIGGYAFSDCSRLATASLAPGSQLTVLPDSIFSSTALTEFLVPATITTISSGAFSGTPLTALNFQPNSRLADIGAYAFYGSRLTSVEIPSGIQTIGLMAFFIDRLESLTLPSSPSRAGFEFEGWSGTSNGILISNEDATAAVIYGEALYAVWRVTAEISISPGGQTDSQVVTIPGGLTEANVPATASLPRVKLAFAASNASATATVMPIDNPAAAGATPFVVTSAVKIVDIQVSGITGPVTVCLDGTFTDEIFHYTAGAWVALPQRSYLNGQVCGVTSSFSPFAVAQPVALTQPSTQSTATGVPLPSFTINSRIAVSTLGQSLKLNGENLGDIKSVMVGGKALKITGQSDNYLVLEIPAGPEGYLNLEITHAYGTIAMQGLIEAVQPYTLTRSIKITKFVGNRPTLAGLSALYKVYRAGTTANILNCVVTVASDATAEDVAKAESLAKGTCQRVVGYSKHIKSAQIQIKKVGPAGSKPVLEITFDRTLGAARR